MSTKHSQVLIRNQRKILNYHTKEFNLHPEQTLHGSIPLQNSGSSQTTPKRRKTHSEELNVCVGLCVYMYKW